MKLLVIHRLGKITAFAYLLTASWAAVAALHSPPTRNEIRLLPPYCQAKLDARHHAALLEQWKDMPFFNSIDHYCEALNYLNRAFKTQGDAQRDNSALARDLFDYSIRLLPQNHQLMPEIYLNRGITVLLMGNEGGAVQDYQKALSLNPKLRGAYLQLADYFASNDQRKDSLKIISEGLRNLPGDKELQRRYTQMGGSLPYPGAMPQPIQEAQKTAAGKVAAENAAVGPSAVDKKDTASNSPGGSNIVTTPVSDDTAQGLRKPEIDLPTNPWCRFCPQAHTGGP